MAAIKDLTNPNPTLNRFFEAYAPRWRSALQRITGRGSCQLLALDALSSAWTIRGRRFAGRQSVRIDRILGSESRVTDFDAAFRPRAQHLAERWCSVARAWQDGVALPPVELICVGDRYFVRDGHHRISVAATFGAREIDALVTVWEVDGPLPWQQPAETALAQPRPAASSATQLAPDFHALAAR